LCRVSCPRRARTRCLPIMEDDYYSIDSILSENQVSVVLSVYAAHVCIPLRSPRKYNVPSRLTYPTWATSVGVTSAMYVPPARISLPFSHPHPPLVVTFRSKPKARSNCRSGLPSFLSIRALREQPTHGGDFTAHCRDYADFTVPPPFNSRVRNALNAEAKSVRLSALVGAGGLWYGFGKIIMRLSVSSPRIVPVAAFYPVLINPPSP